MSGTPPAERFRLPNDAGPRDALAAEYALGTLDAATASRVAAAAQGDAAWREVVQAWEGRLAPLAALARPEPVPPDMWDRIAARITPYRHYAARGPRLSWLWRGWAIAATVTAIGIAVLTFAPLPGLAPPPPGPRLMAELVTINERTAPSWLVDVDGRGQLRLTPFRATSGARAVVPDGRILQFWALLPGATAPLDLGTLPRVPGIVSVPVRTVQPTPDMVLEISLEPEGGSKIGRPSGPVLFMGRVYEMPPAR